MPTRYTEAEIKEAEMTERTAGILAKITHWLVGIVVGGAVLVSGYWVVVCFMGGC